MERFYYFWSIDCAYRSRLQVEIRIRKKVSDTGSWSETSVPWPIDIHAQPDTLAKMKSAVSSSETTTRSVKRATDMLRVLSRSVDGCTLSQVAREVSLSKATAYRILQTLVFEEFVDFHDDTGSYRIGTELVRITLAARNASRLAATQAFERLSTQPMRALSEETGETVALVVRDGDWRFNVAVTLGSHELISVPKVGAKHPLHLGGPGKLMLSFLSPAEREAYAQRAAGRTRSSRISPPLKQWEAEAEQIQVEGFSTSEGEAVEGQCSIAVPVHKDGSFVAVLNLIVPAVRFDKSRKAKFVPLVKKTADQIGRMIEGAWSDDAFNWE